jgi:dTDP-4-amino-4,6-dideoxygalactose transaminase
MIETTILPTTFDNKTINDPWDYVDLFEKTIAEYAGSQYAIAVDCCSNALFLALKYYHAEGTTVKVPKRTYASVPMQVIHAGARIQWTDELWDGIYTLDPFPIVDSAVRFTKDMYVRDSLMCLSFQHRKRLNIGKGGMILTDDRSFVNWCRPMIYDGRHRDVLYKDDDLSCIGYHMYMTPEQAYRGLLIFQTLPDVNTDTEKSSNYRDLSLEHIFNPYVQS